VLFWYQSQPCRETAVLGKSSSVADCADESRCDQPADTENIQQPLARRLRLAMPWMSTQPFHSFLRFLVSEIVYYLLVQTPGGRPSGAFLLAAQSAFRVATSRCLFRVAAPPLMACALDRRLERQVVGSIFSPALHPGPGARQPGW
jgi:hypothetical protein